MCLLSATTYNRMKSIIINSSFVQRHPSLFRHRRRGDGREVRNARWPTNSRSHISHFVVELEFMYEHAGHLMEASFLLFLLLGLTVPQISHAFRPSAFFA